MSDDPLTGYIRPVAICVFRNGSRILVGEYSDPTTDQAFYRPPGGRIEFGELSAAALRREMKEELGAEIADPKLLGVLEERFTFEGRAKHEIIFVYDAEFLDRRLYETDRFTGTEDDGSQFSAIWLDTATIGPQTPPLYPDGLLELLAERERV